MNWKSLLAVVAGVLFIVLVTTLVDISRDNCVVIFKWDPAKERIIDEGSDYEYGARPLKRAIEKLVEDPLSERVLRGEVPPHTRVKVTVVDGKLDFVTEAIPQPAPAAAAQAAPAAGPGTGESTPK